MHIICVYPIVQQTDARLIEKDSYIRRKQLCPCDRTQRQRQDAGKRARAQCIDYNILLCKIVDSD